MNKKKTSPAVIVIFFILLGVFAYFLFTDVISKGWLEIPWIWTFWNFKWWSSSNIKSDARWITDALSNWWKPSFEDVKIEVKEDIVVEEEEKEEVDPEELKRIEEEIKKMEKEITDKEKEVENRDKEIQDELFPTVWKEDEYKKTDNTRQMIIDKLKVKSLEE